MYAGIDLGGTKIAVGLVDETGIIDKMNFSTDNTKGGDKVVADMAESLKTLLKNNSLDLSDISSVGIGCPGAVDRANGIAVYANNLPFLNTPVVSMMEALTCRTVYLANDADCAALGEVMFGAARGYGSAVLITLGTGIGGGLIIDGGIYPGANGLTGEIGHMVIEFGGKTCTCGRKGCLESYVSARGLIELTAEVMDGYRDSLMWNISEEAGVTTRTAFDAAFRMDAGGSEVVRRYIDYLACGVANIINMIQPRIILIGGGIGNQGSFLVTPLRKRVLEEVYTPSMCKTVISPASLGNDAGLIGAAMLGRG